MKIIQTISLADLREMADRMYGSLVKADVDVAKSVIIIDMDMHSDGEAELLAQGSQQSDLWGINLHPDKYTTDEFIEFDSMINIRPRQNNPSRDVLDPSVRAKIVEIITKAVHE